MSVTSTVLDASAMLAYLNDEPGADIVFAAFKDAVMSAVNLSEVLKKTIERKGSPERTADFIQRPLHCNYPF